ncbi:HAD-IA family hydrolase [Synechococcus elongatus]|uniref:HAD family hydrolase n=1 Tax=Synechococcus elongatus PCC 11801 TaxID=2219813 RepID=A0AAN1QMH1_SYNEL|nr:HAD family hydrolase [Synechococcus elongatus]AZB71958.1 hydrolase [Synechococcus elongatus PCC 11801]
MADPQVIFFDAVGTLFGVKGSVGLAYRQLALEFGVDANARRLNDAFYAAFQEAPPLAFPEAPPAQVPALEYEWWQAIARRTFERSGDLEQFSDQTFADFFHALYRYFQGPEPWFVYDDVWPLLDYWRDRGVALGIISNFDSRIYPVLDSLGLAPYFSSVTISPEVGAAKPDRLVFATALAQQQCQPHQAWHIGDSFREDVRGAQAAGLQPIWLKREP